METALGEFGIPRRIQQQNRVSSRSPRRLGLTEKINRNALCIRGMLPRWPFRLAEWAYSSYFLDRNPRTVTNFNFLFAPIQTFSEGTSRCFFADNLYKPVYACSWHQFDWKVNWYTSLEIRSCVKCSETGDALRYLILIMPSFFSFARLSSKYFICAQTTASDENHSTRRVLLSNRTQEQHSAFQAEPDWIFRIFGNRIRDPCHGGSTPSAVLFY